MLRRRQSLEFLGLRGYSLPQEVMLPPPEIWIIMGQKLLESWWQAVDVDEMAIHVFFYFQCDLVIVGNKRTHGSRIIDPITPYFRL